MAFAYTVDFFGDSAGFVASRMSGETERKLGSKMQEDALRRNRKYICSVIMSKLLLYMYPNPNQDHNTLLGDLPSYQNSDGLPSNEPFTRLKAPRG